MYTVGRVKIQSPLRKSEGDDAVAYQGDEIVRTTYDAGDRS